LVDTSQLNIQNNLIPILAIQNIQNKKYKITKILNLGKIVFILIGRKQKNIKLIVNIKF
tara:strand:- start:172 stop:348 length:177 start_codon:yes stop_codon:yes gene_type:complete